MTVKYEKIDEKVVKDIIETPSHMKGYYKKRNIKPTIFTNVVKIDNGTQEYGWIYVEENDDRRRPESCYIGLSTLNEIHEKYYVLNVSPTEHGMCIHVQGTRWNECDKCGFVIWMNKKGKPSEWYSEVHSYFNDSLCDTCWDKLSKKKKDEYKESWDAFMKNGSDANHKDAKRYFKLEKERSITKKKRRTK